MRKILLIDDNITYMDCLKIYLQHKGYLVETAESLEEARRAIKEEMPLLICSDLDLPDGTTLELLDEVRKNQRELPFLIASCHEIEDYEQDALRRGATLCIDKLQFTLLQDKLVEYASQRKEEG